MHTNELKLIEMIQDLQNEQKKYRAEKRQFGNSSTQLKICKRKDHELNSYMSDRLKQIEVEKSNNSKQTKLFNN